MVAALGVGAVLLAVGVAGSLLARTRSGALLCAGLSVAASIVNLAAFAARWAWDAPSASARAQVFAVLVATVAAAQLALGFALIGSRSRSGAEVELSEDGEA